MHEGRRIDLLEQCQTLQEQLMDIDSLDSLITLACTMLQASLFICDNQGYIVAGSQPDEHSCPSFNHSMTTRQVARAHLKSMLTDKPLCNVIRDPNCPGNPCARLTFPLRIGEQALPGAITFFIWDQALTEDVQYLASMIAGAFSVFMRKRFTVTSGQQARRISLLRELLDYKPGLRSYFERSLAMENLLPGRTLYRALVLLPGDPQQAETLAMELQVGLPRAWVFPHKDGLLAVFPEDAMTVEDAEGPAHALLAQSGGCGCVSTAFSDLTDLRRIYEDTLAACRIAARLDPQTPLHRAETWLDYAFLYRCQQYFPLEQYYLEGFRRLHDFDEEAGRGYLATLKAYLDNNQNVNAAAKSIFMHRNTMSQQLDRIEELLGLPVRDPGMRWYLQLCLKIHDLIGH